jgi:hypothetical protein
MIVAPTMDVVRRGILIGSTKKLGSGLSGVLAGRKLIYILYMSINTT